MEPPISPAPRINRLTVTLPFLGVTLLALAAAIYSYCCFLQFPEHLFDRLPHDRNAHYDLGVNLALDIVHCDVGHLFHDLDGTRMWGPLHGILLGVIQTVAGINFRLAVLPSLVGWVLTALLGFLIARRISPSGGTLAGLLAALLILASPAHHAFATDIMLESLGACLTLLVVHAYLLTVQEPMRNHGRWLGLALTLLFFLKYNYWILVMVGLVATELTRQPRFYLQLVRDCTKDWRTWIWSQVKQPWNYPLVVVLLLTLVVALARGGSIAIAGREIVIRSTHNLIHLAYVLFFLRLLPWWWKKGRTWVRELGEPASRLAIWHAWPVALWFLLPKRLGYFFFYISPANGGNHEQSLGEGVRLYWNWLVQEYHPAMWCLVIVLVFVGVTFVCWRRLRPGGIVILWSLLLAAFLTVHHANRKSRFLHSWVPLAWVAAGVGFTQCFYGRVSVRFPKTRTCLAGVSLGGLSLLLMPGMFKLHCVSDGGPRFDLPSNLALTNAYLPYLADSHKTLILCNNVAMKQLARWTYLERYRNLHGIEIDMKDYNRNYLDNRQAFDNWLKNTRCDTLVFIDIPPGSAFYVQDAHTDYNQVASLLAEQSTFALARKIDLPGYGCAVYLWKRAKS